MRKSLIRALIGMVPSRAKRKALRKTYLRDSKKEAGPVSPVRPPINVPPADLVDEFTLGGAIPILYWYFNQTVATKLVITREEYNEAFAQFENRTFQWYDDSMLFFHDALDKYPVKDKTVLVWGLASCNLEAFALWKGAGHVYVVDYNKPDCRHENVTVMTHEELRASGLKTDFSFSFSSFEHDGLGRYGDPLNPSGDLEAMKEAKRYLKPGGIMFFGVPLGQDHIVWNAHRIYGPIRLPLLLQGWECMDVFGCRHECGRGTSFYTAFAGGDSIQPLLVLRASGDDGSGAATTEDKYPTQNKKLLKEITEIMR